MWSPPVVAPCPAPALLLPDRPSALMASPPTLVDSRTHPATHPPARSHPRIPKRPFPYPRRPSPLAFRARHPEAISAARVGEIFTATSNTLERVHTGAGQRPSDIGPTSQQAKSNTGGRMIVYEARAELMLQEPCRSLPVMGRPGGSPSPASKRRKRSAPVAAPPELATRRQH
jgi:hypothetical protein